MRHLLRLIARPVRALLRTIGLDIVRYQVIRPGDPAQGKFAPPASLGQVRERFPFPAPPGGETVLPPESPNGRDLIEDLIREKQVSILLEIGSFLGGSTLRWLRASAEVAVVSVDPWQDGWAGDYLAGRGYPDQRDGLNAVNGLFEAFLRNVLPFSDRVVPVRAASPMVLDELARLGLRPDLVFVDAAKLTGDLVTASELWPEAILTGDDWTFEGSDAASPMRDVVLRFAERRGLEVVRKSETWVITGSPETVTTLVP